MFGWSSKPKARREQVRQHARSDPSLRAGTRVRLASWPMLSSVVFVVLAAAIARVGETSLPYSVGQRIDAPVIAEVGFQVPDPEQTDANRLAARASTPSYYSLNATALTFDRIRSDLKRLYQIATESPTFEAYQGAVTALGWPADHRAYDHLASLVQRANDAGRSQFEKQVDGLPLEDERVVRDVFREPRDPPSTTDYIMLEQPSADGAVGFVRIPHGDLVHQGNDRALRGSAAAVARALRAYPLESTVEAIILEALRHQPTIVFNQERTQSALSAAAAATPDAMRIFESGKEFLASGTVLGPEEMELLRAHRTAYLQFLHSDAPEASVLKRKHLLQRAGLVTLVTLLAVGLLAYTQQNQRRILRVPTRTLAFAILLLGTLLAARLLDMKWPDLPELTYVPCLISASILAIVYPQRYAMGAMCLTAVIVTTIVQGSLPYLLTLLAGVAVVSYQLEEIRSRTKLISAGRLRRSRSCSRPWRAVLWSSRRLSSFAITRCGRVECALLAAFLVSGVLPFIERAFRIATSLTLLEWRDPTKPLLQLLARKCPGTYNHSLVIGSLASAACEYVGANGLLAQVGSLYHDCGKIPKADYFAENQQGGISRHDKLSPTMSLLIILGHVKDGIEMAKEYKLPRVLHQFIDEHHGTTVVRYFHHMASEKHRGFPAASMTAMYPRRSSGIPVPNHIPRSLPSSCSATAWKVLSGL